jgi:hypothetical protein
MQECHSNLFALTRSVVSLNIVPLAAGGILLKFGEPITSSLPMNTILWTLWYLLWILIAIFGCVFNLGAWGVYKNLYEKLGCTKKYLKDDIKLEVNNSDYFFDEIMDTSKGRVYKFTRFFFIICGVLWLVLSASFLFIGSSKLPNNPSAVVGKDQFQPQSESYPSQQDKNLRHANLSGSSNKIPSVHPSKAQSVKPVNSGP